MGHLKPAQVGRRIMLYALPMFGSQTLQFAGSTAALVLLGRLGIDTLGAVAAPLVLMNLACALFAGFATGSMILIARTQAANDRARANRVATQALSIALACGLGLGALGAWLTPAILHAANVPETLLGIAVPYTELLALSLPALFVFTMYGALLHGLGDSKTPFVMLAAFTALYLVGLSTLRIGALGIPIASLAATLLVTIGTAIALYARRPEFRFEVAPGAFAPDARTIREMLRLDLPVNVQYLAIALADLAVISIANGYGARGGAAYAVLAQILAVLMAPAVVFATAVSVSERGLRAALFLNVLVSGAMTLAVYLVATPLLRAFLSDAQTLHIARLGLFTIAWSVFALGIGNLVSAELDSCGQSMWPALTATAGVWLVLVPCAVLFSARWGIDGVWNAYALAYAAIAVGQIALAPFLLRRPRRLREQVPVAPERTI